MKTYVINLERAKERRHHMHRELRARRLTYEWVKAVDGRTLGESELETLVDMDAARAAPQKLTRGAMGAALSHKEVYDRMVRDGVDVALVLEDDMVPTKDIHAVLQRVRRVIQDGEVALLYYFILSTALPKLSSKGAVSLGNRYGLHYPVDEVRSAGAYVLTQETARRLAEAIVPVRVEADDWRAFVGSGALDSVRCVTPVPVYTNYAETQIQLHQKDPSLEGSMLNRLSNFVSRHRLPLLYPALLQYRYRKNKGGPYSRVDIVDEPSPWARS